MTSLKVAVAFVLGVARGVTLTLLLAERTTRFAFESRMEIALVDAKGKEVGKIPAGAPLFSPERPEGGDIGFQAYLPIRLGTGNEAEILIVPSNRVSALQSDVYERYPSNSPSSAFRGPLMRQFAPNTRVQRTRSSPSGPLESTTGRPKDARRFSS